MRTAGHVHNAPGIVLCVKNMTSKVELYSPAYWKKWKEGVNRYEVQKLNEYGQWDVIKIVNHNVNNTLLDP